MTFPSSRPSRTQLHSHLSSLFLGSGSITLAITLSLFCWTMTPFKFPLTSGMSPSRPLRLSYQSRERHLSPPSLFVLQRNSRGAITHSPIHHITAHNGLDCSRQSSERNRKSLPTEKIQMISLESSSLFHHSPPDNGNVRREISAEERIPMPTSSVAHREAKSIEGFQMGNVVIQVH